MQHSIVFGGPIAGLSPSTFGCKRIFTFAEGEIIAGRHLTEDEWQGYWAAASLLYSFWTGIQLLDDTVANFKEFVEPFNVLQRSTVDDSGSGQRGRELTRVINRRLSNYLSSMRLFLDYAECRLKRTYGADSHEIAEFETVCSDLFDDDFSYRFAYKLRNYAQHFGMPIGTVAATGKIVPGSPESRAYSTTVAFNVEELLRNGRGKWGPVKKDLQARAPSIDVASVMRDVPKALNSIQNRIIGVEQERLLSCASLVRATLEVDGGGLRSTVVGHYEDHGDRTGITFDDPPAEAIEYLAQRLNQPTKPE